MFKVTSSIKVIAVLKLEAYFDIVSFKTRRYYCLVILMKVFSNTYESARAFFGYSS